MIGYFIIVVLLAVLFAPVLYVYFQYKRFKEPSDLTPKEIWLIQKSIPLMSAREFEIFCAKLWNHYKGCIAEITPETRDWGKDVILTKNKKTIFIECKHWSAQEIEKLTEEEKELNKVGIEIAMKLKGSMDYGRKGNNPADGGIIMTTSEFTEDCIKYCNAMGIELYDYSDIMEMVHNVGIDEVLNDLGYGF